MGFSPRATIPNYSVTYMYITSYSSVVMKRTFKYLLLLLSFLAVVGAAIFFAIPILLGSKFVEFDEVYWYNTESDDPSKLKDLPLFIEALETGSRGWRNVQLDNITDSSFANRLEERGFAKYALRKNQVRKLKLLSRMNFLSDGRTKKCIPIFRDILVFKKEDKTNAIAMVCFECNKQWIIATSDVEETRLDYGRLQRILLN